MYFFLTFKKPVKMDRKKYKIIPICISEANYKLDGLISLASGFGNQKRFFFFR